MGTCKTLFMLLILKVSWELLMTSENQGRHLTIPVYWLTDYTEGICKWILPSKVSWSCKENMIHADFIKSLLKGLALFCIWWQPISNWNKVRLFHACQNIFSLPWLIQLVKTQFANLFGFFFRKGACFCPTSWSVDKNARKMSNWYKVTHWTVCSAAFCTVDQSGSWAGKWRPAVLIFFFLSFLIPHMQISSPHSQGFLA